MEQLLAVFPIFAVNSSTLIVYEDPPPICHLSGKPVQFVFVTVRSVKSLRLQSRDKQLLGFRSVLGIMAQAVVGKPHRACVLSPER